MSVLFWLFGPIKLNFFEAASESGGFAPDLSFFLFFRKTLVNYGCRMQAYVLFPPLRFEKARLRSALNLLDVASYRNAENGVMMMSKG